MTPRLISQARACCIRMGAFVLVVGCSSNDPGESHTPVVVAGNPGSSSTAAQAGQSAQAPAGSGGTRSGAMVGSPAGSYGTAGRSEASGAGAMVTAGAGAAGMGAAGNSAPVAGSGGAAEPAAGNSAPVAGSGGTAGPPVFVEAKCGANDKPETGLQGGVYPGTVNCGLTLLSELPVGGHVQGSGHCAYVREPGSAPYTGGAIKAYSLADPLKPVQTDSVQSIGGSESMRAKTVEGRAILVSGRGVYDVSNCEKLVKKGEIVWPTENAMNGTYVVAWSSHEIAISHDAKRVYSGVGFTVANIENLEDSATWTVKNWSCEMDKLTGFQGNVAPTCEGPDQADMGRQYSHSSDDNLDGTVWYGANQDAFPDTMEPATARMVDISNPNSIQILDTVVQFPGHSMNWWSTPDGREFIIGANEGLFGAADSCVEYPRPKSIGNALDAYVVEVTGKKFGEPFSFTLDVNKPENCRAAQASGAGATITETSIYNKNGAAFVMMEFGSAGLRVFDLRDGNHPREVAYYNDRKGHVHSGVFHYDEARGIMLASGNQAGHVLMLQPQMIEALGLPKPTDPNYPYK